MTTSVVAQKPTYADETTEALGLFVELTRLGVQMAVDGSTLHYRPRSIVSAEMVEQMRRLKPALLAYVRDQTEPGDEPEEIDPPEPCPQCGSLAAWWTLEGAQRCLRCDPPIKAVNTLRKAATIRQRTGKPANRRGDRMAADLAKTTGPNPDC